MNLYASCVILGNRPREHRLAVQTVAAMCLGLIVVIVTVGCSDAPAGTGTQSAAAPSSAPLVSSREIDAEKPGSVERAFLSYWSFLQASAWLEALSYYDPDLIRAIGV